MSEWQQQRRHEPQRRSDAPSRQNLGGQGANRPARRDGTGPQRSNQHGRRPHRNFQNDLTVRQETTGRARDWTAGWDSQQTMEWGNINGWGESAQQAWDAPVVDWTLGWDGAAPVSATFNSAEELVSFWRRGVAAASDGDHPAPGKLTDYILELETTGKGAWQNAQESEWLMAAVAAPPKPAHDSPESDQSWHSHAMSRPVTRAEEGIPRNKQQLIKALARKGVHWEESSQSFSSTPTKSPLSVVPPTPVDPVWTSSIMTSLGVPSHRHELLQSFLELPTSDKIQHIYDSIRDLHVDMFADKVPLDDPDEYAP